MALLTCDRLPLPNELISLIKSFTWHELEAKRRKYELLLHMKTSIYTYGRIYFDAQYSCYFINNKYLLCYVSFCDNCGNYISENSLHVSRSAKCRC